MMEFLRAFMDLMGTHLNVLADEKDGSKQKAATQQAAKPRTADEQKVDAALQDPEIQAILREPEVQQLFQNMQTEGQACMERASRNPVMVAKLRKLAAAGLINM